MASPSPDRLSSSTQYDLRSRTCITTSGPGRQAASCRPMRRHHGRRVQVTPGPDHVVYAEQARRPGELPRQATRSGACGDCGCRSCRWGVAAVGDGPRATARLQYPPLMQIAVSPPTAAHADPPFRPNTSFEELHQPVERLAAGQEDRRPEQDQDGRGDAEHDQQDGGGARRSQQHLQGAVRPSVADSRGEGSKRGAASRSSHWRDSKAIPFATGTRRGRPAPQPRTCPTCPLTCSRVHSHYRAVVGRSRRGWP